MRRYMGVYRKQISASVFIRTGARHIYNARASPGRERATDDDDEALRALIITRAGAPRC